MKTMDLSNRNVTKAIVTGMSICLPLGIGFGIAQNQIPLGLLAGNTAGFVLGITINMFHKNKQG